MAGSDKNCAICKNDCDGQPRIKDSKGRYFHRTCYDAAQKKLKAAKAPSAGASMPTSAKPRAAAPRKSPAPPKVPILEPLQDDFVPLDDFDAPNSENACPSCGGPLDASAMICIGCGYNRVTGQRVAGAFAAPPPVKVEAPKGKPGKAAKAGSGESFVKQPWFFGAVSFVVLSILLLGAKGSDAMWLAFQVISGIFALVIWVGVVVMGFRDRAVSGVLSLFCWPYHLYMGFAKQDNAHLKVGYGVIIVITLMEFAVLGSRALAFSS